MKHEGQVLLRLARATLAEAFGGAQVQHPAGEPWLDEKRAVFVTLTKRGELRGCIGQLAPTMTLYEAVRDAARAAAFRDPRFPPVSADELDALHVEISVLSPMEPLEVRDEADAVAKLRPGVDGVVLRAGGRSGVFIPEVWKQLPEPADFLRHLKRKAGLPMDGWVPGTRLERFTAQLWEEP
ncbi:MAG: AmmeMemoRadiSam system protein A [Myxococcota bacterium]